MTSELTDILITVDWYMDTWRVCFRREASVQSVNDSDKKTPQKKKKIVCRFGRNIFPCDKILTKAYPSPFTRIFYRRNNAYELNKFTNRMKLG